MKLKSKKSPEFDGSPIVDKEFLKRVMSKPKSDAELSLMKVLDDMDKDDMFSREDFIRVVKPVMRFLCNAGGPHKAILVTPTSAEFFEGMMAFNSTEFVND